MTMTASADTARSNRRRGSAADGVTFWHTLYLGTTRYNMPPGTPDPDASALSPMAFLVEQDPGSTASAHYHQQDQFQLVVRGHATMGLHEVRPLTVHFSGAHTAYGPIRASQDEGVWYFTLRNGFDPGARFMAMAENRVALRSIPDRRHREAVAGPLARPTAAAETSPWSRAGWHGGVALLRRVSRGCRRTRPGNRARAVLGRDGWQPDPRRRSTAPDVLRLRIPGRCAVPGGRGPGWAGGRGDAVSGPPPALDRVETWPRLRRYSDSASSK